MTKIVPIRSDIQHHFLLKGRMESNEQSILNFYSAFEKRDYRTMQQLYADNAIFNDPVFENLNAMEVRSMWEMFCSADTEMKIVCRDIVATENTGSANWIATYTFSRTGRKVVNRITADFSFSNGKITGHTDTFSFYKWSSQALGLPGILLGWTGYLRNKIRKTARKSLQQFMAKKGRT